MNKIVWWTIEVEWGDGKRENISVIPDDIAREVDGFLTVLEEERNHESECGK